MPDPADPATPKRPPRPRRSRKFVLPEHHHDEQADERATEHIEAFLDGPVAPARRPPVTDDRVRKPVELETRPDWMNALRYEGARHARYGRPASVVLLEVRGGAPGPDTDRVARTLADVIRAEARETDRATRVGASTFRLLLPETGARAARSLADRIADGFRIGIAPTPTDPPSAAPTDGLVLCIEVATASRTGTLEDALADAERRIVAGAAAR